jgi:phosphoglycerol transferase MdoB-like AlkP superfamily enzyme
LNPANGALPAWPVRRQVLAILLLALVPSLLVQLFLLSTGNARAYAINLDYLLLPLVVAFAGLAGRFAARAAGGVLAALLMALDGWSAVNQVYFADPLMIFEIAGFAGQWPWRLLLPLGMGLLALGGLLVWRAAGRLRPRPTIAGLLGLILLLGLADVFGARTGAGNLASSATATLARPAINQWQNERKGIVRTPRPFQGASMASVLSDPGNWRPRMLSVSIESWGEPIDPADARLLRQALTAPLKGRYRVVEVRLQPYRGSTLEGEVRELCALELDGIPRRPADMKWFRDCLPVRLAAAGWDTSGWHGNAGSFYRRSTIYPALGFGEQQFFETMAPRTARLCRFLFVGICDRDALALAVDWLGARPRGFAHVMSLDTHLPLPPTKGSCPSGRRAYCDYLDGVRNSLQATADALATAPQGPDILFVYGDHAPPFLDADERGLFRPGVVPFVQLERIDAQPAMNLR